VFISFPLTVLDFNVYSLQNMWTLHMKCHQR